MKKINPIISHIPTLTKKSVRKLSRWISNLIKFAQKTKNSTAEHTRKGSLSLYKNFEFQKGIEPLEVNMEQKSTSLDPKKARYVATKGWIFLALDQVLWAEPLDSSPKIVMKSISVINHYLIPKIPDNRWPAEQKRSKKFSKRRRNKVLSWNFLMQRFSFLPLKILIIV